MLFRIQLPLSIIFLCILAMYFCSFISVVSVFLTPQQTDASVCSISWPCGAGVCIMLAVWCRCLHHVGSVVQVSTSCWQSGAGVCSMLAVWCRCLQHVCGLAQVFVNRRHPGACLGSILWQCSAGVLACQYSNSNGCSTSTSWFKCDQYLYSPVQKLSYLPINYFTRF